MDPKTVRTEHMVILLWGGQIISDDMAGLDCKVRTGSLFYGMAQNVIAGCFHCH